MIKKNETDSDYGTHFPKSRKVFKEGELEGVRVPFRSVSLSPTETHTGDIIENAPLWVYDTSGPWTDPSLTCKEREGVPAVRAKWIADRADTEVEAEPRGFVDGDDGKKGKGSRDPFPGLRASSFKSSIG